MIDGSRPLQLFSSSLDGTILAWDFQEGAVLKARHVSFRCDTDRKQTIAAVFPVERILFSVARPNTLFYVTRHAAKRSKCGLMDVALLDCHTNRSRPRVSRVRDAAERPPRRVRHGCG